MGDEQAPSDCFLKDIIAKLPMRKTPTLLGVKGQTDSILRQSRAPPSHHRLSASSDCSNRMWYSTLRAQMCSFPTSLTTKILPKSPFFAILTLATLPSNNSHHGRNKSASALSACRKQRIWASPPQLVSPPALPLQETFLLSASKGFAPLHHCIWSHQSSLLHRHPSGSDPQNSCNTTLCISH